MATIDELRARAELIAEENQIGGNTAERVGDAFDMVADIIEAVAPGDQQAVLYNPQSPNEAQKQQARENIGAQEAIPDIVDFVKVSAQTFTAAQKQQARENIGAEQAGGAVKNLAGSASDTETLIKAANNPNLQANVHLSGNNIYVNGIAGGIDLDNNGVNIKAGNSGYPNAKVKVNGEEVATKLYVDGKIDDRATNIEDALALIESVIPSQASAQNQLADKAFVNSSISSSTANFVGTFDSLAELQAVQNPTNNDYGFVIETDAVGNEYYDRYKYNGTAWLFEYKVESTPFTAAQWAAIQSGITSALVGKLSALPTNSELSTALNAKADKSDTYTKAEIGNLIVPTNTEIVVTDTLPATGTANTIYRVPDAGGESYTDYGWDGTQFVELATYGGDLNNAVMVTPQNFTERQKDIALGNLGLETSAGAMRSVENEDGFFVTDGNGNIGAQVVDGKIDALGLGDNLSEIVVNSVKEGIANVLPAEVEEEGFFIADARGNVGMKFANGVLDALNIGDNIKSALGEQEVEVNIDMESEMATITTPFGSSQLRRAIRWSAGDGNPVMNFAGAYLLDGGQTLVNGEGDNIAPISFGKYGNLGGNHGMISTKVLCSSVGYGVIGIPLSVNGQTVYVVKVLSDGVVVLPEYTGDTFESLTINTGDVLSGGGYSITATGVASVQLYPFVVSRHKDTYVDGNKVSDSGTYRCSHFRFFDCYDIVDPIDYVRIIKANGGQYQSNPDVTSMGVKFLVRVSIDYEFGGDGICLIHTNFMALEDCNIYLQYGLNVKAMNKGLQDSHLELYVPKTKAIVYDSETGRRATEDTPASRRLTYDYSQPSAQLMNELVGKGDGGLWYTSEDYVGESAPERGIEFLVWGNHRLSLQHGYTFEQSVGGADRIDYAARPWRIRASDGGYTVYPQAYQSGSESWSGSLVKGESYGYTCFRRYHDEGGNASGVISIFPLEVGGTLCVYADFSAAGVYEVDIPSRYIGAEAEVLYKSDTIDAFSVGNSVGTLLTSGQGYCLIKLKSK